MTSWWNSIVVLSMALHLYHMISTYTATLITNIETDLLFFRSGMETSVSESARTRKIFSLFWIGTIGWISAHESKNLVSFPLFLLGKIGYVRHT